ncbi:ATP-binding cassette sub-family G member 8 [Oratosquilla oratoria]|uniref:ATP-binding cassette sub-family G member 8 n=1 Tax=Oratosquilla oratoria TaxID=337810 RepID=UPI003F7608A2
MGGPGMGVLKTPHLQIRGLEYLTRRQGTRTRFLDGISIEARGGEILAILTTNDAEGSCLLDILADRHGQRWGGRLRGDFILNGNHVKPHKIASRSVYVQQDVNFCPDMSVRQTMLLHSFLREPGDATRIRNVKARINALIEDLGLEQVRHTRVKDLTLSERRRLNVACHLLLETDIVLLDQPTRGMDIFDTFFLVEYLRQWACRGRIVVMTIQPPTYEIFTMISRVALISTGRLLYFGRRREMLPYFAFIEYPCPAYKNPSDYYLDLVTLDDLSPEAMLESSQRVEFLADTFRARQEALGDPGPPGPMPTKIRKSNVCMQLLALWIRAMIYQFPYNMLHWLAMVLVAGVMSVLVGAVFWDVRTSSSQQQDSANNRASFHYVMTSLALWPTLLMAVAEVWRDKAAVTRDVEDGLYSKSIYILTKTLYSFLAAGGVFLAYILPAYTMVGFQVGDEGLFRFYIYVGYMLIYMYSVRAMAVAMACFFPSRHVAASFTAFFVTLAALGSGYTVHPKDMSMWSWPSLWWSPVRWTLHELVRFELGNTTTDFACDRNPVMQETASIIQRKVSCGITSGTHALRFMGLDNSLPQPYHVPLIILAFYVLGLLLSFIAFIFFKQEARTRKYRVE